MAKTHYRRVFKSDHLGVADLEDMIEQGKKLIFTIKEVKQEFNIRVAGQKGNFNIAYFNEDIKPLVMNEIRSRVVRSFNNNSPFVEDWSNTLVELYIEENVKMKGEVVGGVRIRPVQPKLKEELTTSHPKWDEIVKKVKAGTSISKVEQYYILTQSNKDELILQAQ
jgi:hypothetical protein